MREGTPQMMNINTWSKSGAAAGEEYKNSGKRICSLIATPNFLILSCEFN
jgi:hypothetical protein